MLLYTQALIDAGFSKHQASAYTYLVEHGPTAASVIARHSGISRTLMYRVLDELEEMGLVSKDDPKGAVSTFTPAHPVKLHEMVERRKKEAEQAAASIGSVVDTMTSEYNKTLGKPGVVFYEGKEGARRVYNDTIVNNKSQQVMVLRSHLDSAVLGHDFFAEYVTKRVKHEIRTQIISPAKQDASLKTPDAELKKTRRYMPDLKIPAEIDIYDDKVAIIAFDEPLIATIIEKKAVADTMRTLFNYMWETLETRERGHQKEH